MTVRPALAVVQCGGPTAVVNASLDAVVRAGDARFRVFGVAGGPSGLAAGALRPLRPEELPLQLPFSPGAWLGAGRHAWDPDSLRAAADALRKQDVTRLVLIGGNGTMSLAQSLAAAELTVVGVPKTVDNDLVEVDHAPGYASAARFLRAVIPGLALDQWSMRGIEPVRIVETLGRDSGWLAAAAATASGPDGAPHLVFTPEQGLAADTMVDLIAARLRESGWVFAVMAEGACPELSGQAFDVVTHRKPLYGGAARRLARLVAERLGVAARGEVLGMAQRATAELASPRDREEAWQAGAKAVELLADGACGVMVGPQEPAADGGVQLAPLPLERVAGRSRLLPAEWVPKPGGVSRDFHQWLDRIVGSDVQYPSYERTGT